jgi:hypothetical protein
LEDIRSGLRNRNNSAIDFVPQGVNIHTKQASSSHPSISLNQRNQRPKNQEKSITLNSLSSPSITSPSPTVPDQRSFPPVVESVPSPSLRLSSEKIQEALVRDDANNNADQKPVHWPKQASTVRWITSSDGSNPTGNVATSA